MKFVEVAPEDIPSLREGHRGRVSYPILKSFLETGMTMAMLDRTGIQQSFQGLYSSLTAYIRSHNLPIKLFSRKGQIYLLRLDTDAQGKVEKLDIDKTHFEPLDDEFEDEDPELIPAVTPAEVGSRFSKEKGRVTK